jgi:hypothetical protein
LIVMFLLKLHVWGIRRFRTKPVIYIYSYIMCLVTYSMTPWIWLVFIHLYHIKNPMSSFTCQGSIRSPFQILHLVWDEFNPPFLLLKSPNVLQTPTRRLKIFI